MVLAVFGSTAAAQDESEEDREAAKRRAKDFESEIIREVERGTFVKAGAGTQQFINTFSGLLSPVMGLNLSIGQDFVDRENLSVAWEVLFSQALHNGPKREDLSSLAGDPNLLIQGDIHAFTGMGMIEVSGYVTRRFGLGIRAGGGIMMLPILMDGDEYNNVVVGQFWSDTPAAVHEGPLPTFGGGPTIEYYTKLSHFSVGIDADVIYVINLDLGIAPGGYLKYTF